MMEAHDGSHRARLAALGWAHFLNDGAANFLPGVLPLILIDLNLSVGLAGSIMGALLIGQGLQPFVGLVADRLGGRALIAAGLLGSSLGGALIGWVDGIVSLVVVLVIIGISNSLFHPQALAGVRRLAVHRPGGAMSAFLVGGEIGRGVWPALASALAVGLGRGHLWLMMLPGLATVPLVLRAAPRLPARRADAPRLNWRRNARPLALLVGYCALRGLMIFSLVTFMPLIWVEAGGDVTVGASLLTVLLVVGVVGNLSGGWFADRFGTRRILMATMAMATVLLGLFTQAAGVWLWLICAALGIVLFATLPLTILVAQDLLPENRSLGSGLALGLANALGAVGVMAVGPLAQWWDVRAPLWCAAIGGLIAMLLVLRMPRRASA